MATTTRTVTGSLPEVVAFIENSVMAQSSSASMEAAVDLKTHGGGVASATAGPAPTAWA